MKKFTLVLCSLVLLLSCKNESDASQDFVSFSGTLTNNKSNVITIQNQNYSKKITVDTTGKFKDTLKIEDGLFSFINGDQRLVIQLKNGFNIDLKFDANNFVNTVSFSGLGAGTNNYIAENRRFQESDALADLNDYFILDKENFDLKVTDLNAEMQLLATNAVDLDSTVKADIGRSNNQVIRYLTMNYGTKHRMLTDLARGKKSPTFNYPDINGKNVSLSSLKGKYVYIDVWATWCGPCKVQIPYLKKLEAAYEHKNIAFVGLSIDTQQNKDKWKTMVAERGIKGYQILADNDWKSTFVSQYFITGIPRFILIDPNGNIVTPDAPRPSEPRLIELFNELNI